MNKILYKISNDVIVVEYLFHCNYSAMERPLKYAVIESREDELRIYFTRTDVSRLNHRELATSYSDCSIYNRDYSAIEYTTSVDRGYMIFEDKAKNRRIFVASKEVGLSKNSIET